MAKRSCISALAASVCALWVAVGCDETGGQPPSTQADALGVLLLLDEAVRELQSAHANHADLSEMGREPDVIYVPTPEPVVDLMLELAEVSSDDVVYDLGCGDGRIVVRAAERFGVEAWGFDIDPDRVAEARANVEAAGVADLVTIEQADIFTLDLSPASVVTLYLLPELNVKLIPQLQALSPGSRVVSHDFGIEGVEPLEHVLLRVDGERDLHEVFLWHTPLDIPVQGEAQADPVPSESSAAENESENESEAEAERAESEEASPNAPQADPSEPEQAPAPTEELDAVE